MINVKEIFNNAQMYNTDTYVADYTEMTSSKKGVEILVYDPTEIDTFHLENPHKLSYWGVNFEEHKGYFTKGRQDCECMFISDHSKPWLLLLEMKYCMEKNIPTNAIKALAQLNDTFQLLKEKGFVDEKVAHIFFNIGVPCTF